MEFTGRQGVHCLRLHMRHAQEQKERRRTQETTIAKCWRCQLETCTKNEVRMKPMHRLVKTREGIAIGERINIPGGSTRKTRHKCPR